MHSRIHREAMYSSTTQKQILHEDALAAVEEPAASDLDSAAASSRSQVQSRWRSLCSTICPNQSNSELSSYRVTEAFVCAPACAVT
jgi:hypothetical protein